MGRFRKFQIVIAFYAAWGLLLSGCASLQDIRPRTVYSDLVPEKMSRSQYYQNLGEGFYLQQEVGKSIEQFRLALLHDPNNSTARFLLAKSYYHSKQEYLALVEIEKYLANQPISIEQIQLITAIFEKSGSLIKAREINERFFAQNGNVWSMWKIFDLNLALQEYANAEAALNKLIIAGETAYKVNLGFSMISKAKGEYKKALSYLQLAEMEKPLDELVMRKQAELFFEMRSWGRMSESAKKYEKFHPYELGVSQQWSYSALMLADYNTALSELQKQTKILPDSLDLKYKIGYAHFMLSDYVQAEEIYKNLFDKTQSDQSIYYLVQIYLKENLLDKAKNFAENLESWSEYFPSVQIQLARQEWKNGYSAEALARMQKSLQSRDDSLSLYQEYAQYLIWNRSFDEALSVLQEGQNIFPIDDQLRIMSAYSYFQSGNEEKFNLDMARAIKLNPKNSEIYSVLSELWYEKRKPAQELEYLTRKAIEMKSRNKNMRPLLAWALLQQDKLTESVKIFEEYYDEEPKEKFFADALVQIYNRSSLSDKTIDYQNRVVGLQMNPQFKVDEDYFRSEIQLDRIQNNKIKTRLPASLENP